MNKFLFRAAFAVSATFLVYSVSNADCVYHAQPSGLRTERGFVEFIQPAVLNSVLQNLPTIANDEINTAMRAATTMWYDEDSMVFMYQDSVEVVVGNRANCVGRDVGETNRDNPGIAKLMEYFGSDYRFLFPFRKAAGTDDVTNVRVLNFWAPPYQNGRVMPVKYWSESYRGRWRWVFPKGTLFGEVLFQKSPNGQWYPFEVRSRKRYLDGWEVNMFRPFVSAAELATTIQQRRPDWQSSANLTAVVNHLQDNTSLQSVKLEAGTYKKLFDTVQGTLDVIPAIDDSNLVGELLTQYQFRSVEGKIWKQSNGKETYGPASAGNFSIVPSGYKMGLVPVNEVSCNRCHVHTGHPLGDLEFDIQLYGEVWGEDRTFTWHPFEPNRYIFGTYDVSDFPDTRKLNPRMVQAELLQNGRPSSGDANYKELPRPF